MAASLIYITVENIEEARSIGRALLEARLAACINIVNEMTSMFWWEGAVQEATEAIVIAKTRSSLVDALIAKVRSIHSYSCPCVIALPIANANPDFIQWIERETTSPDQERV